MLVASSSMRPGHVVAGRYEIVELLGRGGNGAVYRAIQRPLGRDVALKVLLPEVALSGGSVERFKREASLVQQLEHPNTVRLYDFGQTEHGLPFMALELLRGRTLEEEVRRAPMTAQRVGHVASQVLKSLMEAHAKHIIHRDIKPSNVFLADYSGEPDFAKVLDFGVARPVKGAPTSNITKDGQIVGTPTYMAPEQVKGEEVGPTADLQALGLVMAEAMTGAPVYGGISPIDIWIRKSSEDPVPIPALVVRSALGPIIERATRKKASERYPSAGEMLSALERALAASIGPTNVAPRRPPSTGTTTIPLAPPLSPRKGVMGAIGGTPPPSLLVPSALRPEPRSTPSAMSGPGQTARPPPMMDPMIRSPNVPAHVPPPPRPSGPPSNIATVPPQSPPVTPINAVTPLPMTPTALKSPAAHTPPVVESEPHRTRGLATFVAILAAIIVVLLGIIGVGAFWLMRRPSPIPVPAPASSGKLAALTPEEVEKRIEKAGWSVKRRDVQDYGYGYKIAMYDARRETSAATVQLYDYESPTIAGQTADGLAKQEDAVHVREGGKILFVAVWHDQAAAKELLEAISP